MPIHSEQTLCVFCRKYHNLDIPLVDQEARSAHLDCMDRFARECSLFLPYFPPVNAIQIIPRGIWVRVAQAYSVTPSNYAGWSK